MQRMRHFAFCWGIDTVNIRESHPLSTARRQVLSLQSGGQRRGLVTHEVGGSVASVIKKLLSFGRAAGLGPVCDRLLETALRQECAIVQFRQ